MNTTSPLLEQQALVVFSGGQDSATCLAWALSRFQRVFTLGFDYGQRHSVELACRMRVREGIAAQNPLWAERLRWYIEHPAALADAEQRIRTHYQPASWSACAASILGASITRAPAA